MPLFIYLDNIEKNINIIRKYTSKNIMAVVKSNAYGLDSKHIIKTLLKSNIDFFVFEKELEYFNNKTLLDNKKILILESVDKYLDNPNVRYSINTMIDVYKIKNIEHPIIIHIRIDTGMNRFGLRSLFELKKAIDLLKQNSNIYIEGLYTHYSSDCFESNYIEKQQLEFKKYLSLYNFDIIHSNSTRSLNKEIIGNYVRVGMGLYGYHQSYLKLLRSVSLNAKASNIFYINNKQPISYLQKKITHKFIGVINYGYNDIDLRDIRYIYKNSLKYRLLEKSCMNHTHFYSDDKINYPSWLSILPTNGIIIHSKDYNYNIDWYRLLTSLKGLPKNYIRRSNYDIPKILKYNGKESFKCWFRKGSN